MNPYEILEVSPDASPDKIKKSYRSKAKKLHPDHNVGDSEALEKYHDVTRAYEILSDPEKRNQYDKTGKTDSDKKTPEQEFAECILPFLNAIVMEYAKTDSDGNILQDLINVLKEELKKVKLLKSDHIKLKNRLDKIVKKFKRKIEGRNLIVESIQVQAAKFKTDISTFDAEESVLQRALDELSKYEYEQDVYKPSDFMGRYVNTSNWQKW